MRLRVILGQSGHFPQSIDIQSIPASLTSEVRYFSYGDELHGPYNNSDFDLIEGGDLNGDGHRDLVITMSYAEDRRGLVYVLYGGSGSLPSVIERSILDGSNGFSAIGLERGYDSYQTYAGKSAFATDDINGDEISDLIIGAQSEAFVVLGRMGGREATLELSSLDGGDGYKVRAETVNSFDSVTSVGDINGDGIADWAVADSGLDSYGLESSGKVYVVFGRKTPIIGELGLSTLDGITGFVMSEPLAYQQIGRVLTGVGDINGDGVDDLLVGSEYAIGIIDYQPGINYFDYPYPDIRRSGIVYVVYGQEDTDGPASVSQLRAVLAETFIELRWNAPATDALAISGYQIIRNGVVIATEPGSSTSYIDAEAARDTTYTYAVQTIDAESNVSAPVVLDVINDRSVYSTIGGEVYSDSLAEIIWTSENVLCNIYRDDVLVATDRVGSFLDEQYSPSGHTYFVETVPNGDERITRRSQLLTLPDNAGTTPPAKVQDLRFELYSATIVGLFWTRNEQATGPFQYQVIKNGVRVLITDGLSFLDNSIAIDEDSHTYEIVTIDGKGAKSNPAELKINFSVARQEIAQPKR